MDKQYTKLFRSITTSTIWLQPDHVRLVWITMLSLKDRDGFVWGSVPGLAHIARVDPTLTREALAALAAPDADSSTKTDDGRRIAEVDGGWSVINHFKYRDPTDEAREFARLRQTKHRRAVASPSVTRDSVTVTVGHGRSPTDTDTDTDTDKNKIGHPAKPDDRFNEFWKLYPKHVKKHDSLKVWRTRKLDALAQTILDDIRTRLTQDRRWREGFIPDPTTYLRGERWNDEVQASATPSSRKTGPSIGSVYT